MNHLRFALCRLTPAVLLTLILFTGCLFDQSSSANSVSSSTTASKLTPVSFSGSTTQANVTITGLSRQSVYLVKVNNSSSVVDANQTGYAYTSSSALTADTEAAEPTMVDPSANLVSGQFGSIKRYDFAGARNFNANPPAISRSAARDTTTTTGSELYKDKALDGSVTTPISYSERG